MKRIARMIKAGQPFRFDGRRIIPLRAFSNLAQASRRNLSHRRTAGMLDEVETRNGFLCFISDDMYGPEVNAWRDALEREDWKFYGLGLMERWLDPMSGEMRHCYYRSKSAYKKSLAWDEVVSIPGFGKEVENKLDYADFYVFDSLRNM